MFLDLLLTNPDWRGLRTSKLAIRLKTDVRRPAQIQSDTTEQVLGKVGDANSRRHRFLTTSLSVTVCRAASAPSLGIGFKERRKRSEL